VRSDIQAQVRANARSAAFLEARCMAKHLAVIAMLAIHDDPISRYRGVSGK